MKHTLPNEQQDAFTGQMMELGRQGVEPLGETGQFVAKAAASSALSTAIWPLVYGMVEVMGGAVGMPVEARLCVSWLLWGMLSHTLSGSIQGFSMSTALSSTDIEVQKQLTTEQNPATWCDHIREAVAPYAKQCSENYAKLPAPVRLGVGASVGYATQLMMNKAGLPPAARAGLSSALIALATYKQSDAATRAGFALAPALNAAVNYIVNMTDSELQETIRANHIEGRVTPDKLRKFAQDPDVKDDLLRMVDASQAKITLRGRQLTNFTDTSNSTNTTIFNTSSDSSMSSRGGGGGEGEKEYYGAFIIPISIVACIIGCYCCCRDRKPKPPKPKNKPERPVYHSQPFQPSHSAPAKRQPRVYPNRAETLDPKAIERHPLKPHTVGTDFIQRTMGNYLDTHSSQPVVGRI